MNKRAWLFGGLSSAALVGFFSLSAAAAPSGEGADGDAKPAHNSEEDEGPFVPKGRTGKLREETAAVTPKDEGGTAPDRSQEKPGFVGLDFVVGFGKTAASTSATAVSDQSVLSFVLGAKYRLTPVLAVGLRLPYSKGSTTPPGGKAVDGSALGNVEVAGEYRLDLGPSTRVPIELALALPTAQGDLFVEGDPSKSAQAFAGFASLSARGYEDNALFMPHRFSVVPRVGLEYEQGAIRTGGFTKFALRFKSGGADLPQGATALGMKLNSMAFDWVTGGEFFYAIGKFQVGARAWLALLLKDDVEVSTDANSSSPNKLQFVAEPAVRANFGPARLGVSYILPLGGRLGGDNSMSGIRFLAGAVF